MSETPIHNLLTVEELAKYLRIPLPTVYYLVQPGKIPAIHIGARWRRNKVRSFWWACNVTSKQCTSTTGSCHLQLNRRILCEGNAPMNQNGGDGTYSWSSCGVRCRGLRDSPPGLRTEFENLRAMGREKAQAVKPARPIYSPRKTALGRWTI